MPIYLHGRDTLNDYNSGVIGLTTALRILEKGYQVEIIAEVIPTDPKSIKYTSHWAVSLYLLIVYLTIRLCRVLIMSVLPRVERFVQVCYFMVARTRLILRYYLQRNRSPNFFGNVGSITPWKRR